MFKFLVKELHKKTEWMYMKVGYTKTLKKRRIPIEIKRVKNFHPLQNG